MLGLLLYCILYVVNQYTVSWISQSSPSCAYTLTIQVDFYVLPPSI